MANDNVLSREIVTIETSLRLSARQVKLIRPGVALIVKAYRAREEGERVPTSYQFHRVYPLSKERLGTFDELMMKQVDSMWTLLTSRSTNGIRLRLNTFQIRACMFGLRIEQDFQRHQERWMRKRSIKNRPQHEKNAEFRRRRAVSSARALLAKDSARVIHVLQRHMKRANRIMKVAVGVENCKLLVGCWQRHLQWMRIHLVYYRIREGNGALRRRQKAVTDNLVEQAVIALQSRGYLLPAKRRLRALVRLAHRYHRQARPGYMLHMSLDYRLQIELFNFISERCNLRSHNEGNQ